MSRTAAQRAEEFTTFVTYSAGVGLAPVAEPQPEPAPAELLGTLLAKPSRIKVSKSRAKREPDPVPMIRVCCCGSISCPSGPFMLIPAQQG